MFSAGLHEGPRARRLKVVDRLLWDKAKKKRSAKEKAERDKGEENRRKAEVDSEEEKYRLYA